MGSTREAPVGGSNKEAPNKEAPVDTDAPVDENSLYDEDGYSIGHSHKYPGDFTTRAEDEPPPSGPGWREVWKGKSKGGWKTYYRDPPSKDKNKDKKPPAKQKTPPAKKSPPTPSKAPAPPPPASKASPSTSPSTSPGTKAIEKIEKDFSGDKDWLCIECIIAGLAKGIAWALGAMLLLALLPEELVGLAAAAMFALMLKGLWELHKDWGSMTSKQKQEAIATIIGGLLGGLGGAKFGPKPGSFGGKLFPKAPPVGVTPEGVPMPIPDEGPTGDAPMEASGGERVGGSRRPDIDRGPGGAKKHSSHGSGSDDSHDYAYGYGYDPAEQHAGAEGLEAQPGAAAS